MKKESIWISKRSFLENIYFVVVCNNGSCAGPNQLYFLHSYSHDYFIFNNFNMLVMSEVGKHKTLA